VGEVNVGDNLDRGLAYSVGTATAGARWSGGRWTQSTRAGVA